jgi:hypothetical protein
LQTHIGDIPHSYFFYPYSEPNEQFLRRNTGIGNHYSPSIFGAFAAESQFEIKVVSQFENYFKIYLFELRLGLGLLPI